MENKAPGTTPRAGGYAATSGEGSDHLFHPKMKTTASKQNIQRAGLRSARRVGFWFTLVMVVVVMTPTYVGPFYIHYAASKEWLERATKTIWQRRNEEEYPRYFTQRKNGWLQWLGLKPYNISGETNVGEIQNMPDYVGSIEAARRAADKATRECVIEEGTPGATRYLGEALKRNRLAFTLYAIALVAPAVFLTFFYCNKMSLIRSKWRDPYALPDGFDPATGQFMANKETSEFAHNGGAPKSLILTNQPGSFTTRKQKLWHTRD